MDERSIRALVDETLSGEEERWFSQEVEALGRLVEQLRGAEAVSALLEGWEVEL